NFQACVIDFDTSGTEIVSKPEIANFASCFLKNRKFSDDPFEIGEGCNSDFGGDDWNSLKQCFSGNDEITKKFEDLTKPVSEEIQTDGLVVRVQEKVNDNAKKDLVNTICGEITVSLVYSTLLTLVKQCNFIPLL